MHSHDLEDQDQLHDTDLRHHLHSDSNSLCDCKEDRLQEQKHASDDSALGHSMSQPQAGEPLQPARSYLTCLSDVIPDTTLAPVHAGEGEQREVEWDGDDDPMNPRNMHGPRKWLITFTVAFCSMCVTCTSSLYTMTYSQIDREFGNSRIIATLGLSLFVLGLGLSPMILGPLSEFYGRRPIYITAFIFFAIWLIPCALAPNIQTMLVARFFDGLSGSAFLSVAGGTVGDMFDRNQLQAPMMIYTASPFIGPALGPIMGGFINHFLDWRWSFYILLIWSGLMLTAIVFFVPETYPPVVSSPMIQRASSTLKIVALA